MTTIKVLHSTLKVLPFPPTYPDAPLGIYVPPGVCADAVGDHDVRGTIMLDPSLSPCQQAETLIHEVLHALWDHMMIPPKPTEEDVVSRLGVGLATVLLDNPKLAADLMGALVAGKPIIQA